MSPTLRKKKSWKDLLRSPRLDPAEQPEVPKSPNPGYISDSSQRENKASKSTGSPYLSPEEFERRGSTFSSASAASEQQPFQARERTPSERTPSVVSSVAESEAKGTHRESILLPPPEERRQVNTSGRRAQLDPLQDIYARYGSPHRFDELHPRKSEGKK